MMNVGVGVKLTGHFTVEKWSRSRGTRERLEFDNIVLDVGWNNLKSRLQSLSVTCPEYLFLGTGTTEPSPSDTGLESLSGTLPGKETSTYNGGGHTNSYSSAEGWIYYQKTMQFDYGEGEAEGAWNELGLAFDSAYTEPYNRSLFRDSNGTPITLTILSDEFLTVYVRLRMYFDATEKTGTFNYNGAAVGYTYGMAVYRGSFWYQDVEASSPFGYGLMDYIGLANDPRDDDAAGVGYEYTWPSHFSGLQFAQASLGPDLAVSKTFAIDPGTGTEVDIYGVIFRGRDYKGGGVWLYFDTPITKLDGEKLTGSASIQWFRDETLLA